MFDGLLMDLAHRGGGGGCGGGVEIILFFCRGLGCETGIFIQSQSLANLQRPGFA